MIVFAFENRSQWPRGLRRRSSAARLLRLWVRIPRGAWMYVCCECCVLSGRGLYDELITRPEESYRLARRCVWSRNLENEETKARYRAVKIQSQWAVTPGKQQQQQQHSLLNDSLASYETVLIRSMDSHKQLLGGGLAEVQPKAF